MDFKGVRQGRNENHLVDLGERKKRTDLGIPVGAGLVELPDDEAMLRRQASTEERTVKADLVTAARVTEEYADASTCPCARKGTAGRQAIAQIVHCRLDPLAGFRTDTRMAVEKPGHGLRGDPRLFSYSGNPTHKSTVCSQGVVTYASAADARKFRTAKPRGGCLGRPAPRCCSSRS